MHNFINVFTPINGEKFSDILGQKINPLFLETDNKPTDDIIVKAATLKNGVALSPVAGSLFPFTVDLLRFTCWIIFIFIRYWFWCHMNRYCYCILCSIWIRYLYRYFIISWYVCIRTVSYYFRYAV